MYFIKFISLFELSNNGYVRVIYTLPLWQKKIPNKPPMFNIDY